MDHTSDMNTGLQDARLPQIPIRGLLRGAFQMVVQAKADRLDSSPNLDNNHSFGDAEAERRLWRK